MKPESCLLCVHLRRWPIDRLRRRQPALRHEPLVLVDPGNTRQVITAVSPEVPGHVQPGMTLAQALAHDSTLRQAPADLAADRRALEALGRWLMRFSPNVAIDPPASIFLDATGLERLFGDVVSLCQRVQDALARLQICAGVAAAPTPGAAWALAWGDLGGEAAGVAITVDDPGQILSALAPLPPDALRLDPIVTQQLWGLGLNTVQLLLAVPRLQLVSRFGPEILKRIDQVGGIEKEPLAWLPHRTPIVAEVEFEGAVESLEVIHLALRQLLDQACEELTRRQQGARELRVSFRRPYAPALEKSVHLTRASRDCRAMFKLLQVTLETLESDDGFISLQLAAPRLERLGHRQRALVGGEVEDRSAAVDHLIERLAARLEQGRGVEWAETVEAYVPERAYVCANPNDEIRNPNQIRMPKIPRKACSVLAPSPGNPGDTCGEQGWGEGDFGQAEANATLNIQRSTLNAQQGNHTQSNPLPDYRERGSDGQLDESLPIRILNFEFVSDFGIRISDFPSGFRHSDFPTRPLTLLSLPREIAVTLRPSDRADGKPVAFTDRGLVHRISAVAGPERIGGEWWNGHWKTRDYYDVQDESGRRHWVFCVAETRRWFLHGVFE